MKRHSKEDKEALYRKWQSSGQSKTDFARAHGIERSTFYLWCRKIKDSGSVSGFQSIEIDPGTRRSTPSSSAILHFPSGVVMELHGELDAGFLQTLVR